MDSFSIIHILIYLILLPLVFLPSIIAAARKHPKLLAIFLINLFLSWTVVGWIGALVWSLLPISQRNESI